MYVTFVEQKAVYFRTENTKLHLTQVGCGWFVCYVGIFNELVVHSDKFDNFLKELSKASGPNVLRKKIEAASISFLKIEVSWAKLHQSGCIPTHLKVFEYM